jgi:hypothetical protein
MLKTVLFLPRMRRHKARVDEMTRRLIGAEFQDASVAIACRGPGVVQGLTAVSSQLGA